MSPFSTRDADWLSFESALSRVQRVGSVRPTVSIPLEEACGLALARDVLGPMTLPPGPTSHMDGYAVRFEDCIGSEGVAGPELAVREGDARPGMPWPGLVDECAAVRIMTGALVPEGADTVIPVEHTDRERHHGTVRIDRPPRSIGQHVRPAGQEVREGQQLAAAGDTVTPGSLALLGAATVSKVDVVPGPRVALVVTGDELVSVHDRDAISGGVLRVDVLSLALPPLIDGLGARPLPPRRAPDRTDELRAALEWAAGHADLVVTTGGASMGRADLVKDVLDDLGFALDFWRVKMRPGSPFSFGRLPRPGSQGESVPILGLPGNPTSAVVTFLALGAPCIRALGGHARRFLPSIRAVCAERIEGPEDLHCLFRVALAPSARGEWEAHLAGDQGSGAIRSLSLADGLAVVPEGVRAIPVGDPIEVMLLPHMGWPRQP